MDYREVENRMARHRDLIKERANDRLVVEAKKANKPEYISWFGSLRSLLLSLRRRRVKPQLGVQPQPLHQFENY